MKKNHLFNVLMGSCFLFASLIPQEMNAQKTLAFPTAEGYGKYTVGGRGGDVYEVTNLNDSGEGSLREAISAKGPRTVVFRVSGTIDLQSPLTIRNPYITIAGQTAPGDGITIKRHPLNIAADEVIIRYIRVRLGDESGHDYDAISCRGQKNIILDHVSASWSIDETLSVYMCENVTIQWCMITESLSHSNHVKGSHGFGGIWGSNYSTYHHNLIAHHSSRNPRFASGAGYNDYRNNVVYNWGYQSCYGGEYNHTKIKNTFGSFHINFVANYYKPGPGTQPGKVSHRIVAPSYREQIDNYGKWYIADNVMEGNSKVTKNNWDGGVQVSGDESHIAALKMDTPWNSMKINDEKAAEAYKKVLKYAGANLPNRDAVDKRIIEEVRGGYATYEGKAYKLRESKMADHKRKLGIIDSQEDVGGWPELKSLPAPVDTDHDGMPDEWEKKKGLNPKDAQDRNGVNKDGYTHLEVYLNSLAHK